MNDPQYPLPPEYHRADDLIDIFNRCFAETERTHLVGGADEPLYSPALDNQVLHTIYFRSDYFASALHEVAHWCVAGRSRRTQEDYGYWYAPDGRNQAQQALFEQVEVRPQAFEWVFSRACGYPFRVSADNLALNTGPSQAFKRAIAEQAQQLVLDGLPARTQYFAEALSAYYRQDYRDSSLYAPEYLN